MNLFWVLNRLRSMSLAEIAHRVREKAKKSLARGNLEGWDRYQCPGPVPTLPGLSEHLETQGDSAWLGCETKRLLAGEFAALGVTWPPRPPKTLFPPELWRLDPVTGDFWPGQDVYCFDIPYRHERRLGDIKYVWEINRLQFLQPLALQVCNTGDPAALAAIESAIQSWTTVNPPFRGLGWNSGIELGLRAISLLVVTTLCGDRLSPTTIARIRAILHAQAVWMDRYPSRYSSANNHLIAETAGEFLTALAMPDLPLAARLETKSRRILTEEANKQFYPDGVPAEQSPTYGAFSAEFLWLCAQTAEAAGRPLPETIRERLVAFADFTGWLTDPAGRVPAIGDDDEGRVLCLGPMDPSYPVSVCRRFADSTPKRQGIKTFHTGGYTVIHEQHGKQALQLVFDHGPLGYLSIAAHGHADALAVVATLDGEPLFVDPGTYLYHSGGAWRDWFRGTRAHNTLTLAAVDQSRIAGPFNWSHKARVTLEDVREGDNWSVTASHDGYRPIFGCIHRRTLFATEQGFSIHDQLDGSGQQPAEVVWQLDPACEVRRDDHQLIIRRNGRDRVAMRFDPTGELRIASGGALGAGGGWVSPAFGEKVPAPRIAWHGLVPAAGVTTTIKLIA
ncbi:heparinase II/III family protein [Marichromatium bheemlicum]|uniref:Heparinase n=1 Tax=Marichromatium bheemlicum TaxID=365339 RepID=A0ABX1ICB5_9GAMM|nr:alginate lyase family protein [Marichromatium bheemlicum]NKN34556.1 heparinase [Marichromatium bheemlicum]